MKIRLLQLFALIAMIATPSCEDVENLNTLLDRIEKILRESPQDWIGKLIEELDGVRGEAARDARLLLQDATASAGIQPRCLLDMARQRIEIHDRIKDLRANLQEGEELSEADLASLFKPFVCDTMPKRIDLTHGSGPASLTWNGFNLDPSIGITRRNLRAWVTVRKGNPINVTRHLTSPNVYEVTLNLSGSGFRLENPHHSVQLRWGADYKSSILLSEVAILSRDTEKRPILPTTLTINPDRINGNDEFGGNGPMVTSNIRLVVDRGPNPKEVRLVFEADFREHEGDGSRANGSIERVVYRAPEGWAVVKIIGATPDPMKLEESIQVLMVGYNEVTFKPKEFPSNCTTMVDRVVPREIPRRSFGSIRHGDFEDHGTQPNPNYARMQNKVRNVSSCSNKGLVSSWVVRGDNRGDDIGRWSSIRVNVREVKVEIRKVFQ